MTIPKVLKPTLVGLLFVGGLLGFYFAYFFVIDSSPNFNYEQKQVLHFVSLISGFVGVGLSFYLSRKFGRED